MPSKFYTDREGKKVEAIEFEGLGFEPEFNTTLCDETNTWECAVCENYGYSHGIIDNKMGMTYIACPTDMLVRINPQQVIPYPKTVFEKAFKEIH